MKNTGKNKAKFYAQYLKSAKVLFEEFSLSNNRMTKYSELLTGVISDMVGSTIYTEMSEQPMEVCKLELKPLSQITDEDAAGITEIMDWSPSIEEFKDSWEHVLDWETSLKGQMEVTDFLRSKGYALPYMGISVKQQIEWGWIILKK